MTGFRLTKTIINSTPLFLPGGSVNRWSHRVARQSERAAITKAPPFRSKARRGTWATGKLAKSIYSDVTIGTGLRRINVTVGSTSDHAVYVHEGTANKGAGYIPLNGNKVTMPITRIPYRTWYAERVRGQRANPFLVDGYNSVARRHRLPRMR